MPRGVYQRQGVENTGTAELPDEIDVVVVGSGYTGLHTALQTARAGLGTLVLDSHALGAGCSSRNGGQVSTSVKGSYSALAKKYGGEKALSLMQEGVRALNFLEDFVQSENIACDWHRCGHFRGAHNSNAYSTLAKDLEALPPQLSINWHMVPKSEQRGEIGSDRYHGGVVFEDHGVLHPAKYHQGLLEVVQAAGATTIGHCPVQNIERTKTGYLVHTDKGVVRAASVAVATNGYTGPMTPWLRRRVIPIGSYIIATQPLDEDVAREISPQQRTMTDTRKLVFYYRLCPEGRRMIFGGRVALAETDPAVSAPALRQAMCDIFPQLTPVDISHTWVGFVGYTFDSLPHVGRQPNKAQDGVYYSMGYCGSGISLSSYFGSALGRQICADKLSDQHAAGSVFMDMKFPTRPLYTGNPWFLKPSVLYYKLRDRMRL